MLKGVRRDENGSCFCLAMKSVLNNLGELVQFL